MNETQWIYTIKCYQYNGIMWMNWNGIGMVAVWDLIGIGMALECEWNVIGMHPSEFNHLYETTFNATQWMQAKLSKCNQVMATKRMQASECKQVNGTKWIQAIDATKWLQPNECNQVNAPKWMQPSECNQVDASKWMQANECNQVNTTKWIQTKEYNKWNTRKWMQSSKWNKVNAIEYNL